MRFFVWQIRCLKTTKERLKNLIRVGGYGGYFFENEKILKKWNLYEWKDTVGVFLWSVRWGGTWGGTGGWYEI